MKKINLVQEALQFMPKDFTEESVKHVSSTVKKDGVKVDVNELTKKILSSDAINNLDFDLNVHTADIDGRIEDGESGWKGVTPVFSEDEVGNNGVNFNAPKGSILGDYDNDTDEFPNFKKLVLTAITKAVFSGDAKEAVNYASKKIYGKGLTDQLVDEFVKSSNDSIKKFGDKELVDVNSKPVRDAKKSIEWFVNDLIKDISKNVGGDKAKQAAHKVDVEEINRKLNEDGNSFKGVIKIANNGDVVADGDIELIDINNEFLQNLGVDVVTGDFHIYESDQLTSFKGVPKTIYGMFSYSHPFGGIKEIDVLPEYFREFATYGSNITKSKVAWPETIDGDFILDSGAFGDLSNGPKHIKGNFKAVGVPVALKLNQLPSIVDGDVLLSNNSSSDYDYTGYVDEYEELFTEQDVRDNMKIGGKLKVDHAINLFL